MIAPMPADVQQGEKAIIPELITEAPKRAIGTKTRNKKGLKENDVAKQSRGVDSHAGAGRGAFQDVAQQSLIEWGMGQGDAKGVPQATQQQAGQQYDPQTGQTLHGIAVPCPSSVFFGLDDRACDEKAAQHEEHHDRGVPEAGHEVKCLQRQVVFVQNIGKIDKDKGPGMPDHHQYRRHATKQVEGAGVALLLQRVLHDWARATPRMAA